MAVYILTEFNSKSAVSKKIFYTRPKFNDIIDSLDFYDSDQMLLVRVDEPGWFKFDKYLILADKCSKQYADEKMCIRVGDFYLHYFSVYVDELLPTYEWLRKIND